MDEPASETAAGRDGTCFTCGYTLRGLSSGRRIHAACGPRALTVAFDPALRADRSFRSALLLADVLSLCPQPFRS